MAATTTDMIPAIQNTRRNGAMYSRMNGHRRVGGLSVSSYGT